MKSNNLEQRFSIARVALLVRNRLIDDLAGYGIAFGILVAINLIGVVVGKRAMLNTKTGDAWSFVLMGMGFLFASFAFKDMHDGKSGTDWILLPATSLEKYTCAVLSYVILLPLAAGLVMTGLSALLAGIEGLAGGAGNWAWSFRLAGGLEYLRDYAIGALVLIAGSAAFRKKALIKTLGVACAYAVVLAAFATLLLWIIGKLGPDFNAVVKVGDGISFTLNDSARGEEIGKILDAIAKSFCYAILPPFALVFGYFRVSEKEARDEVQ